MHTTVPVLYRHKDTGRFESAECAYYGPVARKVWASVNKQFLKLNAANYFYPCEPADAYHAAIREVERVAGEVGVLSRASVETYLMNVGHKALCHFHCRVVAPMREEYRRVEPQLDAEDDTMTARELAEALPGEPDAVTRRREAAFLLEEIYAKLPKEVVLAFRAYVAAEGNMFEAAHLARMSRTDFYRKWPGFLAMARKVVISDK